MTVPTKPPPADGPPATGSSQEVAFLFSVELPVSVTQIWENLPHLKAVVMYGETPVEKVASVYTVRQRPGHGGGGTRGGVGATR